MTVFHIPKTLHPNEILRHLDGRALPMTVQYVLREDRETTVPDINDAESTAAITPTRFYSSRFNSTDKTGLARLLDRDLDWIPEPAINIPLDEGKAVAIPKEYFSHFYFDSSAYVSFNKKIGKGFYQRQPGTQVVNDVECRIYKTKSVLNVSLPPIENQKELNLLNRILNAGGLGYAVSKSQLKAISQEGRLSALLQLGVIIASVYNAGTRVKFRIKTRYDIHGELYPPEFPRNENLLDFFSSEEEIQEIQKKQEEAKINAIYSNADGAIHLYDNVFEIFESGECKECGNICRLSDSLTCRAKEEQLREKGIHTFESPVIPGTFFEEDENNPEAILCERCQ